MWRTSAAGLSLSAQQTLLRQIPKPRRSVSLNLSNRLIGVQAVLEADAAEEEWEPVGEAVTYVKADYSTETLHDEIVRSDGDVAPLRLRAFERSEPKGSQ